MAPVRLKTTKQLKAAHQKEMGRPQKYSAAQLRTMERRHNASQKAESIRNRDKQKRKNAQAKKEKELKQLEIDRQQVREGRQPPEFLWGRVHASQPRLHTFFKVGHQDTGSLVETELEKVEEEEDESEQEGDGSEHGEDGSVQEEYETEIGNDLETALKSIADCKPSEGVECTQYYTWSLSPIRSPPPSSQRRRNDAPLPVTSSRSSSKNSPATSYRNPTQGPSATEEIPTCASPQLALQGNFVSQESIRNSQVRNGELATPRKSESRSEELLLFKSSGIKRKRSALPDEEEAITQPHNSTPQMIDGLTLTQLVEACKDDFEDDDERLTEPLVQSGDHPVEKQSALPSPQRGYHLERPVSPSTLQISFEETVSHRPRPGLTQPAPKSPAQATEMGRYDGLTSSQVLAVCYGSDSDDLCSDDTHQTPLCGAAPGQHNEMCLRTDEAQPLVDEDAQTPRPQPNQVETGSEGWHSDLNSDVEVSEHMRTLARGETNLPTCEPSNLKEPTLQPPNLKEPDLQSPDLPQCPQSSQYSDEITEEDLLVALEKVEKAT